MRFRTLALVSSLCLVPLACGDDDGDDAATTLAEAAEGAAEDAVDTAADAVDSIAPDTSAESGGEGGGEGEAAEFCSVYADLEGELNLDPAQSPAEVEATLTALTDRADDLVEAAPEEIRDDVEKVAQAFTRLKEEAEANGYDLAPIATDPELEAEFTSGEFDEAGTRMEAYYDENCATTATS